MAQYTAAVITVSDSVCSGTREDTGGPLTRSLLEEGGFSVTYTAAVPDERDEIAKELIHASDDLDIALIVTTGGTGFAPRDVTPEATMDVCPRLVPGIPEAMRAYGMKKTDRAMLSRAQAGIRGRSLIINLPGSPKAIRENLEAVLSALDHGIAILRKDTCECGKDG